MQRQGDLLIVSIKEIPIEAILQKSRVLAEGEATGHLHLIDEKADVFERNGTLYFRVNSSPAVLRHPEHGALRFDIGDYKVIRQREFEPAGWRYIRD